MDELAYALAIDPVELRIRNTRRATSSTIRTSLWARVPLMTS